MNLLSILMPGFRSLRTPVTAGVMWLSFVLFLLAEHQRHLHLDSVEINSLDKILPNWFAVIALPAIIAVSYVLGSVLVGITSVLMNWGGNLIRRLIVKLRGSINARRYRLVWRLFYRADKHSTLISTTTRSLLLDTISNALVEAGAPSISVLIFPLGSIEDNLPLAAAQLSQTAPAQYQEYDRIKAESEFRIAIVPPLIALAVVVPLSLRPWLMAVAAVSSVTLLIQAVGQMRESSNILANAAYLGYIKLVPVQAVAEHLRSLTVRPENEGQWIGAIIAGLSVRGFFEESDDAIHELMHFEPGIRKAAVAYLKDHDKESAALFGRLMRQENARRREATTAESPGSPASSK